MNIPNLRFAEFERDWVKQYLADMCLLRAGKFIAANQINSQHESGMFPCYGGNGVRGYARQHNTKGEYPLVGRQGALCGNVNFAVGEFYATEHALIAYPGDGIDVNWLFYLLGRLNLNQYATGQAQPGLSVDVLNRVSSTSPPTLAEQQKIAAFLGAVDSKLATLRRKQTGLERFKSGLMQRLFSQELRFTQDDGSAFPDWQEKRLGDVAEPIRRQATELNAPAMTISSAGGFMMQEDRFSQVIAGSSLESYTELHQGEFSYNRGASNRFQFGCVYKLNDHAAALVPFVYHSFAVVEGVSDFFAHWFHAGEMEKQLRPLISSSARLNGLLNIGRAAFMGIYVPFPHPDEQRKIADALSALDTKITATAAQITKTERFKQGLLQQMFV